MTFYNINSRSHDINPTKVLEEQMKTAQVEEHVRT